MKPVGKKAQAAGTGPIMGPPNRASRIDGDRRVQVQAIPTLYGYGAASRVTVCGDGAILACGGVDGLVAD